MWVQQIKRARNKQWETLIFTVAPFADTSEHLAKQEYRADCRLKDLETGALVYPSYAKWQTKKRKKPRKSRAKKVRKPRVDRAVGFFYPRGTAMRRFQQLKERHK